MEDIARVAQDYFEKLFMPGTCDRVEECLDTVTSKITPDMQQVLGNNFRAEEVKTVLFQMAPTKAHGLDSMNAFFYQKFWHIVGDTVVNATLDFLKFGHMVPEINHTHLVLIPKIKTPEKNSNFRHISFFNVIYKLSPRY